MADEERCGKKSLARTEKKVYSNGDKGHCEDDDSKTSLEMNGKRKALGTRKALIIVVVVMLMAGVVATAAYFIADELSNNNSATTDDNEAKNEKLNGGNNPDVGIASTALPEASTKPQGVMKQMRGAVRNGGPPPSEELPTTTIKSFKAGPNVMRGRPRPTKPPGPMTTVSTTTKASIKLGPDVVRGRPKPPAHLLKQQSTSTSVPDQSLEGGAKEIGEGSNVDGDGPPTPTDSGTHGDNSGSSHDDKDVVGGDGNDNDGANSSNN